MHPISALLCEAYDRLFAGGEVQFPLYEKQRVAIDTIVKTVNASYFGIVRFPTPEKRAVAYLCYIIKNHPVTDGNKRLIGYAALLEAEPHQVAAAGKDLGRQLAASRSQTSLIFDGALSEATRDKKETKLFCSFLSDSNH